MPFSGTDPESYLTEQTFVYEEYPPDAAIISQPPMCMPRMKHILSKPPLHFSCCRDGTHPVLKRLLPVLVVDFALLWIREHLPNKRPAVSAALRFRPICASATQGLKRTGQQTSAEKCPRRRGLRARINFLVESKK